MSGKAYKKLHSELSIAISKHDKGEINDSEMQAILNSVYKEYDELNDGRIENDNEALLKLFFRS